MISALIKLPRHSKQLLMVVFDILVITSSLFAAFYLRLGYFYFPVEYERLFISILISPVLAIPIFFRFGLYREVIRYVSFESIWGIIQAVTLYAVIWGLLAFMVTNWTVFPRSVILINWLLVLLIIAGSRLFSRWLFLNINSLQKKSVLIYGAGAAGRELSIVLSQSKIYKPVAFIDDDSQIYHQTINGLKVFSKDELEGLIFKKKSSGSKYF
jgi:FlaA1/EpsC-like NDP-sugar epimerase